MSKLFRILGIAAMIAVIGFSFTACGGDSGGGGVMLPPADTIPAKWARLFVGDDGSTATLSRNGVYSWTGWSIPDGVGMGATITAGGTLSGSSTGEWVYFNNIEGKAGIIVHSVEPGYKSRHYFVGLGNRAGNGVSALLSALTSAGVTLDPEPNAYGYSTNYGFWGSSQ